MNSRNLATRWNRLSKPILAYLSLSLALAMTLTACTAGNAGAAAAGVSAASSEAAVKAAADTAKAVEPAAAATPETVEFYTWTDEKSYMDTVVAKFNEKSGDVDVQVSYIPPGEYSDKVLVMFSGGSDFDVLGINGINMLNEYADKKALATLTPYLQAQGVDVTPYGNIFQQLTIDGQSYGIPYRSTCWMLFYNTDIFDREGLPYPTQMTWDEYAALALKLTKTVGEDRQWGGYWAPWVKNFYSIQKGVTLLDDDTTAMRGSAELLNRFYNVDKSHMSLLEMNATKSDYLAEFEKGNIALFPQGDWTIALLLKDEADGKSKVNWDIAPMPVPEGVDPGTTWGQQTYVGINEKSTRKDSAFAFIRYVGSEEGDLIIAESGILPGYNSAATKDAFLKKTGKMGAESIFEAKVMMEYPPNAKIQEVSTAYSEEMELCFLGEQDIDKAMANFEKRRAEILTN